MFILEIIILQYTVCYTVHTVYYTVKYVAFSNGRKLVNICEAALYIALLEGQKVVNTWGVVNLFHAALYYL